MPYRKINFEVNAPLNLFRATVANADTGSIKSLYTFFDTYLKRMLVKFDSNCIARNVQNFELFDKKPSF